MSLVYITQIQACLVQYFLIYQYTAQIAMYMYPPSTEKIYKTQFIQTRKKVIMEQNNSANFGGM